MDYKDLWQAYKEGGDTAAKDELIINYVPLVKSIAGRLFLSYNSQVEYDDIVGYGIIGLIDAIEKFDHKKEIKFETYASIRIRGAVVDHMRVNDWVPRSVRSKYRKLEEIIQNLQHEHGGDVSDEMIANELGMTNEEYAKYMDEVTAYAVVSLEEKIEQNASFDIVSDYDDAMPEKVLERSELKAALVDALGKLPERERTVMELYYYSELTYKEIAEVLDVTESRISQIHTKAIAKLRTLLSAYS